jgi:hypothetical protein
VLKPLHYRGERRLLLVVREHPVEAHAERHQIDPHRRLALRPDPPGRPIVAAMPLRIGGRQGRLADTAQPVQCGNRDPALVAAECRLDCSQRLLAAHEMRRHPDRDIGGRIDIAERVVHGLGSLALGDELAELLAGDLARLPDQVAAADVGAEPRQAARLDLDQQNKTRLLFRRDPETGAAFQGRIGRLQILFRDDAEHVMGRVDALLHPGIDILAAFDLPFVDVRGVAERLQLLRDPERPVAIALRIADEEIVHARMIAAGKSGFKPRIGRGRLSS